MKIRIKTYDYSSEKAIHVDLKFYETEKMPVESKPREQTDEGFTTYDISVRNGTLLNARLTDGAWSVLGGRLYFRADADCAVKVPCFKKVTADKECAPGSTKVNVQLTWCEKELKALPCHVKIVATGLDPGASNISEVTERGNATLHLCRGHLYQLSAPGYVFCYPGAAPDADCGGNPSIFVCDEGPIEFAGCLRPERLLTLAFEDPCGKPAAKAECSVDGRDAEADKNGKIYIPNPSPEVHVITRGEWVFQDVIVQTGSAPWKSEKIVCHRAQPANHIIRLEVEGREHNLDGMNVVAIHKGAAGEVIYGELDSKGRMEKKVAMPGTYLVNYLIASLRSAHQ
jgi:hypothetical protein